MATQTQYWDPAQDLMYLTGGKVSVWYELNPTQAYRAAQAMALWDDVSNFTAIQAIDDTNLAAGATNLITVTEYFLGFPYNTYQYWQYSLSTDWTRVAVGDIINASTLGINISRGDNLRYHEVYVDVSDEGLSTFQLGSRAFDTLVHELGHSVIVDHISGSRIETIMSPSDTNVSSVWYPSTPMTLDIDRAIALYGATTNTRTGNETYGYNAHFSGAYREAFDFSVNTRPLSLFTTTAETTL